MTSANPKKPIYPDNKPGWFWRTPEGQELLLDIERRRAVLGQVDPWDDPELGWQREED